MASSGSVTHRLQQLQAATRPRCSRCGNGIIHGWWGWPARNSKRRRAAWPTKKMWSTLRHAVTNGFKDVAQVKKDTDLAPLRTHPDFPKLLKELEAKAQPEGN